MAEKREVNVFVRFASNVNKFNKNLLSPQSSLKKLVDDTGKLNMRMKSNQTSAGRLGTRMRFLTTGLRGFRMEMLSVMFFGMGMNRMFMGLLQPSMQLAGVFELFSQLLGVMFLPVALAVLDWGMRLFDLFQSLPEPVQTAIGYLLLIGAAIGILLFFVGTLVLGIGGLITAFSAGGALAAIPAIFAAIGTAIAGAAATIAVILAVLVLFVIGFVAAWKENFGNIQGWFQVWIESIKGAFQNLFSGLGAIIKIFTGIFTGDIGLVKEGFKQMVQAVIGFFKNLATMALAVLVQIGLAFLELIKIGFNWGKDLATNFFEGFKGIKDMIVNFFKGIWKSVVGSFSSGGSSSVSTPKTTKVNDFILSKGRLIKTSPEDTVLGTKNPESIASGGMGNISFSPNITINASSNVDIERLKSQLSTEWRDELDRVIRR